MFYKALNILPGSLVFDIGANIGDKSALFSKFSKNVVTIEPDIHNHKLLTRRFQFNSKISLVNSAVGCKKDKALLYVNTTGSPANTLSKKWKNILEDASSNRWSKSLHFENSYEVNVTTLDLLIEEFGSPYFIKIDVEGFELEVLQGLEKAIPIISLEANFPEFRSETEKCIEKIQALSENAVFNCTDENHDFFWPEHKDHSSIIAWIKNTDLKYFERFSFSSTD